LSFEVPLAEGVSGFYPLSVPSAGGSFSLKSFSEAELQGTGSTEEVSDSITHPDTAQKTVYFRVSDSNIEEGEDRWIVSAEERQLRIKGAKRQASSSGYSDLVSGFKRAEYIDLTAGL